MSYRERDAAGQAGVAVDLTWQAHAACRGTDVTELWYPVETDPITEDHADYCTGCPVFERCLVHAIRHEQYGVWALTDEEERKRLRREAGIRLTIPGWLTQIRLTPDDELEPDVDDFDMEAAAW